MRFLIVPLLLSAVLLNGCHTKEDAASSAPPATANSIVGSWTTDDPDVKGATIVFRSDGGLVVKGPAPSPKGATMELNAFYKLAGDKLTRHLISGEMFAPLGADSSLKKEVDGINAKLKKNPKSLDRVDTLAWVDKTLSSSLTRMKKPPHTSGNAAS